VSAVHPDTVAPERGLVGRPTPRIEDRPLLRGEAVFCGDLQVPGMLEVAFLRSDRPHARLVSVDVAAALELAGVRLVATSDDVNALGDLTPPLAPPEQEVYSTPRPLLARDRVRYVGEPVAAVVAASRYEAEDACEAIAVSYEDLPAVASPEAALAEEGPPLHPVPSNVLFEHDFDSGGVDDALAAADFVVERVFRVPRLAPAPLEPRGIVAVPGDDGLTVWYSTQTPFVLRRVLAELLGLSESTIRVVCPYVGGGFGQKSHVYPEDVLVPWLALRCHAPVRWLEDRVENLTASCHARDQVVRLKAAAHRDGRVTAIDADVTVDVGAYGIYPHGQLLEALGTPVMLTGPYRIAELRFRSRAVATNTCPGGGYRGVGLASAVFVHERLMDIVARQAGLDPAEVRRRNLIAKDELPKANPVGLVYDSGDYRAALETALAAVGPSESEADLEKARRRGSRTGLGLCSYVEYTGMGSNVFQARGMVGITGHEESRLSIEPNGTALLRTSVPSTGQGSETALAQLVADALDLDLEQVVVAPVDTSSGPDGSGSFGSRGTVVGGSAALRSSASLIGRLLEVAAGELEVSPSDLEITRGAVQARGVPSRRKTYAELAAAAPDGYLDVRERHDPEQTTFSYGVHACLVEIDPSLGSVRILRYVVVEDCGRVVNPLLVEGQAHGSTVQGIGAALLESVVFDEAAQPLTTSFVDYLLPTSIDHPPPDSIGGFKGIGEGGTVAAPAAVTNAIAQAIGAEINVIPVTPELVVSLAAAAEGLSRDVKVRQ
jgi:aerobic carbon-monoxide dehydrogenase large subunit